MNPFPSARRSCLVGLFAAGLSIGTSLLSPLTAAACQPAEPAAAPAAEPAAPRPSAAWTLEDAMAHLRLYPRDVFAQYVALQLARREGKHGEIAQQIQRSTGRSGPEWAGRGQRLDLFSIFTGALAVQETLQLDTMRGPVQQGAKPSAEPPSPVEVRPPVGPGRPPGVEGAVRPPEGPVDVAKLEGPTIQSHPWTEMLAGRSPATSPLAACVPYDFYYIRFDSLKTLLEVFETGDLWGTHLFSQTVQQAYSYRVGDRYQRQLAVETSEQLQPFYDHVVQEVAVTGSDLYFREGTDVTLLLRFNQRDVFKASMKSFLVHTEQRSPNVTRTAGSYREVDFVHLTSPDGRSAGQVDGASADAVLQPPADDRSCGRVVSNRAGHSA